jgi:hypothetical protein
VKLRVIVAVLAVLQLSVACVPVSTGGAGSLSNGEPINGTVSVNASRDQFDFALLSPRGWQCNGTAGRAASPTAVRTIPLSCSNGASGNLVVTMNQFADQMAGSFALSNGITGQVTFGSNV